jgi:hypothetical protein
LLEGTEGDAMENGPEDESQDLENSGLPADWVEKLRGNPLSIVVPPYLRFLMGQILLVRTRAVG